MGWAGLTRFVSSAPQRSRDIHTGTGFGLVNRPVGSPVTQHVELRGWVSLCSARPTGGGSSCWWHGAECGGGGGTEPAERRALLRAAGRRWRSRSQPATDPAVRKHGAKSPPPPSPTLSPAANTCVVSLTRRAACDLLRRHLRTLRNPSTQQPARRGRRGSFQRAMFVTPPRTMGRHRRLSRQYPLGSTRTPSPPCDSYSSPPLVTSLVGLE